jgi:uncharacterized protein
MIFSIDLAGASLILIVVTGVLVGMSKVGIPGMSLAIIPLLALAFGGKSSTGVLLPMLVVADVFGVSYYHRHANWKHVLSALPWAVVGVVLALFIGNWVNDAQFKSLIAVFIFSSLALMFWRERKVIGVNQLPNSPLFAAAMGLLGGVATMIGNAAGPIFAIYLLALRLEKNEFIGTSAWFFFIINLFKFPLHVFVWKTITLKTLSYNLVAVPFIVLGAYLGIWIVKRIPNSMYRWFIIAVTVVSALMMLF